jgi:hypothetical protein
LKQISPNARGLVDYSPDSAVKGEIMKISGYLKRIIWNDKVVVRGAGTLRAVLCALFIALIALFFTSPVGQHSIFDQPVPLPAELGLE